MDIENPLDKAAELAKNAGEGAAGLLGGVARFLEQVTGDAFTAAVFAAMLLFTLSLIKSGSGARNPSLYARTIVSIGILGIIIMSAIIVSMAYETYTPLYDVFREKYLIYKGITGLEIPEAGPSFFSHVSPVIMKQKWFILIFITMTVTGVIMLFFTRTSSTSKTIES